VANEVLLPYAPKWRVGSDCNVHPWLMRLFEFGCFTKSFRKLGIYKACVPVVDRKLHLNNV
jgi:hypothetical protein